MNRSNECVVAVYKKLAGATDAMRAIDRHDLSMKRVSLVSNSLQTAANVGQADCDCHHALPAECPRTCEGSPSCEWSGPCVPKILQFGDSMEKNALLGATAGGLVGLVAGAGALTVSKGETAYVLGPIMATTSIVGAYLGAMASWGVHRDQLSWYEKKVKAGHALLMVHGDPLEVATARQILEETSPAELHVHAETSADSYEIHDD